MNPEDELDYEHPAAYDPAGRPLYYRPASPEQLAAAKSVDKKLNKAKGEDKTAPTTTDNEPSSKAKTKAKTDDETDDDETDQSELALTPEKRRLHDESAIKFPELNLSPTEYVLIKLHRHPIGWIRIWVGTLVTFVVILICTVWVTLASDDRSIRVPFGLIGMVTAGLTLAAGAIATWVYRQNRFYVTNERVIDHVQQTLFSMRKQSVGLDRIEEVSYRKEGVLQSLLNYGTIRLATVGDETTYPFTFVADPINQLGVINNTVLEYDRLHGIRRPMKP
jgi:hypothetical protein